MSLWGAINDQCVLTLPFRTIDDRYPDVFVERKLGGSFLVHDAGRTTSSLYAQGIHMTEGRIAAFGHIGATLGVGYSDGTFQVLCSDSDLQAAILAVAECILFGTMELLAQKPVFDGNEPDIPRALTREEQDLWLRNRKGKHCPITNAKPGENLTDKLDAAIYGRCLHEDFIARVDVHRLIDSGGFMADVQIRCKQCDLPFEFVGVNAGMSFERPMCSVSAQELHAPIRPKGSKLLPGIPGYEVKAQ